MVEHTHQKELVCEISGDLKIYTAPGEAYMIDGLVEHQIPYYYVSYADTEGKIREIDMMKLYFSITNEKLNGAWKSVNDQLCIINDESELSVVEIYQLMNDVKLQQVDPSKWYSWPDACERSYIHMSQGYIKAKDLWNVVNCAAPSTYSHGWGHYKKPIYDPEQAAVAARALFEERIVRINASQPPHPTGSPEQQVLSRLGL